jgi:hypothetical protein
MSDSSIPPGPWSWQWDETSVGESAQNIYNFLDKLWGNKPQPSGKTLRDELRAIMSEPDLKYFVKGNIGINIPEDVRLILVDIEDAKTTRYRDTDPSLHPFYVLVIPPTPRRYDSKEYKEGQALSVAWFHATTDGWGM